MRSARPTIPRRRLPPFSFSVDYGPVGGAPGGLADLTTTAGVHLDGTTGAQSTAYQTLVQTTGYHFLGYQNECSFGSDAATTASDIGDMGYGYFVTGGGPTYVPYQQWPLVPTFIIVSVPLCWGYFNATDAVRQGWLDAVAAGDTSMDGAFTLLAQRIHAAGLDPICTVRLGWESTGLGMSGAGYGNYPWVSLNIGAHFAAANQHAVTVMRAAGYTGKFEWNLAGAQIAGSFDASAYPGDSYVDVIGVDTYDKNGTQDTVLATAQAFAVSHSKQFGMSEWGYLPSAGDDTTYMTGLLNYLAGLPAKGQPGGLAYQCFFDSSTGGAVPLTSIPNSAAILKARIA